MEHELFIHEKTPDGWMVYDSASDADEAPFAIVKGPGAEQLALRIANALNTSEDA